MVLGLCLLCGTASAESLAQINQPLERPEDWEELVTDSEWSLGECTPYAEGSDIQVCGWGTYPSIDGSTVSVPMGMELARQLLKLPETDLTGFVTFSTTPNAYERLILGQANTDAMLVSQNAVMDQTHPVDLILVTEPSDEELALAKENGVELAVVPFCCDAFVFLVNAENPVENLATEQIRQIYTGEINDWSQTGGTAESAPIYAYQRAKNSGSQTAMENMVMKDLRMVAAQENEVTDGMSELVEHIGDYTNGRYALGYSFLYYVTNLYRNDAIKVLSVDGVAPTEENIRSGAYPYTVHYYAVYRKGDEATAAFVDWLTGPDGQFCVRQAGYIPLS